MAKVFFSFSKHDLALRDELEVHLSTLKRQGIIETWHDRQLVPGSDVHRTISDNLESADLILLLVSPHFLASEYCYEVEMTRALERHGRGEARVIPVILEYCDWQAAPFGGLSATPTLGQPITKFANRNEAFLEVAKDIRRAVEDFCPVPQDAAPGPERPVLSSRLVPRKPDGPESTVDEDAAAPGARSSNLRIRRDFSDREKDAFLRESFGYIARFFENSLQELEERYEGVTTTFEPATPTTEFSAAVYLHGRKETSCRVSWGNALMGDICYSAGDSDLHRNSVNEALTITTDGHALLLRTMGLFVLGSHREALSQHGAAEHLWSILIGPLQ